MNKVLEEIEKEIARKEGQLEGLRERFDYADANHAQDQVFITHKIAILDENLQTLRRLRVLMVGEV